MDIKFLAIGSRPWELLRRYWGFSCLIDDTILFDTFSSYRVMKRRLDKASIDLKTIQNVVVSHDHWDHIGGLWGFLEEQPNVDVHLPSPANEKTMQRILETGGHVLELSNVLRINEHVYLSGGMQCDFRGKKITEQFLSILTDRGQTIVVGCSHPGIVPIVQRAKELFDAPVYAIVGGLHLMHSSSEEVIACANSLKEEGVVQISPTHCTGNNAEKILHNAFGNNYIPVYEGCTFSV